MLHSSLTNKKVLSLRTGAPIGSLAEEIINPNNLKIEGWYAIDNSTRKKGVLLNQDVRDILPQGIAVNDHEAISDPNELIRLKEIMDIGFELNEKKVRTESGKRLGKIMDFAFDKEGYFIEKIYVRQSVVKSFSGGQLIIDRSQIVEVTHDKMIVKDAVIKLSEKVPAPAFSS
ncbi:MAG: PRC-barrel domain-containing protein [bacterium]|nr:PRC-barrel domain-containing protein [bacterium]